LSEVRPNRIRTNGYDTREEIFGIKGIEPGFEIVFGRTLTEAQELDVNPFQIIGPFRFGEDNLCEEELGFVELGFRV
jgi:hypothetical protein